MSVSFTDSTDDPCTNRFIATKLLGGGPIVVRKIYFCCTGDFSYCRCNRQKRRKKESECNQYSVKLEKNLDVFPESGIIAGRKQTQKDWHDYEKEAADKIRSGPGEQGKPYKVEASLEEKRLALWNVNGYDGLASDIISLDRA
ncbi:unnamed protein product, partial [Meganyctiphanes norvegica]